MNQHGLKFHHFGLATKSPDRARAFLAGLGYRPDHEIFDPNQKVHVQLAKSDSMPTVELIWPGPAPGPLDGFFKKRDSLVYHLCFETTDLLGSLLSIESTSRATCISAPQPAVLFDGSRVSFYEIAGFGMIEIIERAARAASSGGE